MSWVCLRRCLCLLVPASTPPVAPPVDHIIRAGSQSQWCPHDCCCARGPVAHGTATMHGTTPCASTPHSSQSDTPPSPPLRTPNSCGLIVPSCIRSSFTAPALPASGMFPLRLLVPVSSVTSPCHSTGTAASGLSISPAVQWQQYFTSGYIHLQATVEKVTMRVCVCSLLLFPLAPWHG